MLFLSPGPFGPGLEHPGGRHARRRPRWVIPAVPTVSDSPLVVRGTGERGPAGPARAEGAVMTQYLLYFNQQWVGDHTEEWFRGRGPLARAVVDEMQAAGVYVFAGGLEEDGPVYSADATSGTLVITDGPFAETKECVGGFSIVDVADDET